MKTLITALLLTITTVVSAQLQILDYFNSIGGIGEWSVQTGPLYVTTNVGVKNGYLTYNTVQDSYLTSKQYEFRSPDYKSTFANCGCDSLKVTFKVEMDVRSTDKFRLIYRTVPTGNPYKDIPASGQYTFVLPTQLRNFSFNFVTWGQGSTAGKYVRIDYFFIECQNNALAVELLNFEAKNAGATNLIAWLTASENATQHYIVEHSTNGYDWRKVATKYASGAGSYAVTHTGEEGVNYYKLSEVTTDGTVTTLGIRSVEQQASDEVIAVTDFLGRTVTQSYNGERIVRYSSGKVVKVR